MHPSRLDGIHGAGEVRCRRRSETTLEFRGVFAFRKEHEAALVDLLASQKAVEFAGIINGERRLLQVRLTDMSLVTGLAYFQGLGDPYDESRESRAG